MKPTENQKQFSETLKLLESVTARHLMETYTNLCACCDYMLRCPQLLDEGLIINLQRARVYLSESALKQSASIEIEEGEDYKKRAQIIFDLVSNVLNKMPIDALEHFVSECKEGMIAEAISS